jgi:hypothetical protein
MQAILRWDKDHGDSFEPQPRPKLSLGRKHALLKAVRAIQRCRYADRWNAYVMEFRTTVEGICAGSAASARDIIGYFEANWFSDEWRGIFSINFLFTLHT